MLNLLVSTLNLVSLSMILSNRTPCLSLYPLTAKVTPDLVLAKL